MNDFHRCNKVTGVYWLKQPANNIKKIKISIKPQDGISLPKFEHYSNKTNLSTDDLESKTEVHEFSWQQKVFSRWELQRYSDQHNCITDNELNHHDAIQNNEYTSSKVFTYIHKDDYLPFPFKTPEMKTTNNSLNLIDKFKINEKLKKLVLNDTSSSTMRLFRSEENLSDDEQWNAMHVVFDNSEYSEDSNLLLKQEAVLLSIYHNSTTGCLMMSPDSNDVDLNPYAVETSSGVRCGYKYGVDVEFEDDESGDELMMLLKKLSKKWEKIHRPLLNFELPSLGKRQYCVCIEILSADNFDLDHLYIDYTIQVPEQLQTDDQVRGSTHVTKSTAAEDEDDDQGARRCWHYSHLIQLNLQADIGDDTPPITLILEAISTDWWGRHRTEGYTHLSLTLTPGRYEKQLSCSRPEEKDSVEAHSRRFFVGGCHLIQDLDVLTKPQMQDASYKFTKTGNINLRWNTICQSQTAKTSHYVEYTRVSSSSALLLGAETALKKYRKARAKLAAATKGLSGRYTDGGGDVDS